MLALIVPPQPAPRALRRRELFEPRRPGATAHSAASGGPRTLAMVIAEALGDPVAAAERALAASAVATAGPAVGAAAGSDAESAAAVSVRMPVLARLRRSLSPRVRSGPFALLVGVVVTGIVSASAASIGPVWATMTSDVAVVTYSESVRRASDVKVELGAKSTVAAATVTITGPELANLTGQVATIVLLDSTGTSVAESTATLGPATNLVIGASTATFRLSFASPPPRSKTSRWAVIVAGLSVLGPSFDTPQRTVTTGTGSLAAN